MMVDLKSNQYHAAKKRRGFLCFLALDESLPYNNRKRNRYAGFTLLEMLVVIGLLGVVMLTATTYIVDTGEIEQQNRQEENVSRWQHIRTAIIGDANSHLNQQPMIHSYVADMGRLPSNIDELITRGVQSAWSQLDLNDINAAIPANTTYLWGGWRGPYLYTAGSQFFRDAWLNVSAVDDAINHGWAVTHTPVNVPACTTVPDCTDMSVQSLGDDGAAGGVDFNADYPANPVNIVSSNEWQISAANIGFNVVLNKAPGADQSNLQLKIYFVYDGVLTEEESSEFAHLVTDVGASSHVVMISSANPAAPIRLPLGKYAAVIMCTQGTPNTADDVVYSGDCANPAAISPYYFTLLPSAPLPITISWNIP